MPCTIITGVKGGTCRNTWQGKQSALAKTLGVFCFFELTPKYVDSEGDGQKGGVVNSSNKVWDTEEGEKFLSGDDYASVAPGEFLKEEQ